MCCQCDNERVVTDVVVVIVVGVVVDVVGVVAMWLLQADAQSCAPDGATRNPLNKLVERVFDTAGRHAMPPFMGPMAPQQMQAESGLSVRRVLVCYCESDILTVHVAPCSCDGGRHPRGANDAPRTADDAPARSVAARVSATVTHAPASGEETVVD